MKKNLYMEKIGKKAMAASLSLSNTDINKKSIHEDEDLPHLDFDVQFDGE